MVRVIIADDQRDNIDSLIIFFEQLNIDVDCVANGAELVSRVRDTDYKAIVTDNVMPEMDGLTAVSRIREFSQVPICMLSGSDSISEYALQIGVTKYILKGTTLTYELLKEFVKEYVLPD